MNAFVKSKSLRLASLCLPAALALGSSVACGQATITGLAPFPGAREPFFYGGLLTDTAGNVYGTTCEGGANDDGSVLKIAPDGTVTTLATFTGSPFTAGCGGLLEDATGNLYGALDGAFKLTPNGTLTWLQGSGESTSTPIADKAGNLYGTAWQGGVNGAGFVYRIAPDGTVTTLASFNYSNGSFPESGLTEDAAGNLYGATHYGGIGRVGDDVGDGTIFELSPDGTLRTLIEFNGSDGSHPVGALLLDAAGNLYGTTSDEIFKLTPDGTISILATFNDALAGGLIEDAAGNFYGATSYGGTDGTGSIFRLTPDGTLTTLASLNDTDDGTFPDSVLVADSAGNLYGTTWHGNAPSSYGVVFEVSNSGFVVPEPSSISLLALAAGGLLRRRRRNSLNDAREVIPPKYG